MEAVFEAYAILRSHKYFSRIRLSFDGKTHTYEYAEGFLKSSAARNYAESQLRTLVQSMNMVPLAVNWDKV